MLLFLETDMMFLRSFFVLSKRKIGKKVLMKEMSEIVFPFWSRIKVAKII
jgi:hypothetical protein